MIPLRKSLYHVCKEYLILSFTSFFNCIFIDFSCTQSVKVMHPGNSHYPRAIFKKLPAVRFYGIRLAVRSRSDVVTPYLLRSQHFLLKRKRRSFPPFSLINSIYFQGILLCSFYSRFTRLVTKHIITLL